MDHNPRLSEILYLGLCAKIGTPTEVTIRRDVLDIEDMIEENIHTGIHECSGRRMLSGSKREGFRFNTSDWDFMMWFCDCHFLINDISQLRDYVSSNLDIVLMDDTDTTPGFVRLQLLTRPRYDCFSLVPLNDRIYISSLYWRQLALEDFSRGMIYQNAHEHGPCSSGYLNKSIEIDRASCFACKYWPRGTNHWTERCHRHKWPPASVLKNILNDNYHCVAIGNKSSTIAYTLDWRLSFSLAEQKLVFAMNHTQFICYGLLKIFLKDVINKNVEEPLLCSYFMKTTMFWLIQVGNMNWSPNNLLECFWMCFKYLVQCVNRGKFANFFIPQNNMFMNKIIGTARESLLDRLNQYYRMGLPCLLLSSTLKSILEPALIRPCRIQFTAGICNEMGCACKDLRTLEELKKINLEKCYFFSFLKSVDTLLNSSLSPYKSLTLQWCTADVLALTAFVIVNYSSHSKNRQMYNLGKMLCNMLKLSSRIGTISHSLYLALYYYRTGRYNKALDVSNLMKRRLSEHFILYYIKPVDRNRYSEEIGNLSLYRKMKAAWVVDIKSIRGIHFIEELMLEQEKHTLPNDKFIRYPVFVLVEMMSVLSNYRLGNRSQYLQSLTDLHTLLLYDDGRYVSTKQKDISWQILGICQQVVGDFHGALQSYQESLKQETVHKIQRATHARIYHIRHQLNRNQCV